MRAAHVRELAVWAVVLFALELLLISKVDPAEVVLAACLAVPFAAMTVLARAASAAQQRTPAAVLRWLLALPLAIVKDTGALWVAVARGRRGSWRELPLPRTAGDDAAASGRRAWSALVLTASPSSICADIDPATGTARVHDLGGSGGSGLEKAVAR